MKRQATKWEKIFANHVSDKWLMSQNIKRTHTTQQEKQSDYKMGRRSAFFQSDTDGLEEHEKMPNINDCQGNTSQNNNEMLPQTHQNGCY